MEEMTETEKIRQEQLYNKSRQELLDELVGSPTLRESMLREGTLLSSILRLRGQHLLGRLIALVTIKMDVDVYDVLRERREAKDGH